ncbi:MAG: hypothetical protein A3F67_07490 [Verrucomicrobia bacterium RIFCSPHIGHO2_12_FULL_41_10]|nr:MAG: hypothetical protein A3F67_07490 [Verrucomicrobia bacterium RIFCSPHIGHO2_12_FULL_41_10]HLB32800.1 DUF4926 domain-containing protein [Chthoniobacterales bacterium]
MNSHYNLFDVVTLLKPYQKISQGAIGTIVEKVNEKNYLVEFSDDQGCMVALEPLEESQLELVRK